VARILVIDDDVNVLDNIAEVLRAEGHSVATAEDGVAGLLLVEDFAPEAIVSDLKMPVLDGYGVLKAVRGNPRTSNTPFILLSALKERRDVRGGMDLGADDYLTKPFTPQELVNTVSARLEKQRTVQREARRKLDQLRDSMAMTFPHEMLTPLNGILGYSRFLTEELDQLSRAEIRELTQGIDRAGKRLERLVRKFLLYAEVQNVGDDPERSWLLKGERTHSVRPAVAESAAQAAMDLNRESDLIQRLEDAEIRMAETYWRAIVYELIENALKFSESGSPVEISLKTQDRKLIFTVTNTGRGMTPEQIAQVGAYVQFERKLYEQQGSGLGLILAKRLTELHDGTLEIQSVPGVQTLVRASLPVHAAPRPK
jgi:two-component system sensor histidine kinase/response regulator